MDAPGEIRVVVFRAPDERRSREAGFVLTALGIEHEVVWSNGDWQLTVRPVDASRARQELGLYQRESRLPGGGTQPLEERGTGWPGVFAYVGGLLLLTGLSGRGAFGLDWLGAGRLEAGRVMSGEWWRAVTALTLHVDASHLAGNLAFGGFFGLYVGRYLGGGVGWALILAGGVLGNLINAFIQPAGHRAIGASTAVFAALGLLAAYTWRKGFLAYTPWKVRIAPVIAGIALLAFTGSGAGSEEGSVDVLAHLTGFMTGFGLGVWMAVVPPPSGPRAQRVAALIAGGGLALAWVVALGVS